MDYSSNLVRNRINVLVSKNAKEQEGQKTQNKVDDDRRYTIEAAIIKVMKNRRKIDH